MPEKKKDNRARTWTFIVYPESVPNNWRELLDSYHIPWVESPLHDKDVNPDGTIKKPHWHVILMFDGKKSYEQIKEITDSLNAPVPQKTANPKGLVRYLIHMDNPEKYQYSREDIVCHSGAEVEQYFQLSSASRLQILKEMIIFIKDSRFENYLDFLAYCIENGEDEWLDIAVNHNTLALSKVIDSVYQKNHPKTPQTDYKQTVVAKAKEMARQGTSQRVIADTLGISPATVNRYLKK
ncbi:Rep family protein [Ligilactobacillus salivarius]